MVTRSVNIAASLHSSRSTISEVQELARKADLSFPLDESVTNEVLLMTFHPERLTATNPRVEPDYSLIHKELAKTGVNLSLLWTEYCEDAYSNGKIDNCTLSGMACTVISECGAHK